MLRTSHLQLQYHVHPADHVVSVINANSGGNLITANQLISIGHALNLNLTDIDTVDSRLFRFYRNFTTKGGNYDAKKLTLLGVLLAKGSLKVKLGHYFDCVKLENEVAGDFAVKTMFDTLVTIAAVYLPLLAVDETPRTEESFSRQQYEDYRDRLQAGKDPIVHRLMTAFLGTVRTASKDRFLKQGQEHSEFAKCLSSPVLLRTEMLVEAANIQKGAAIKEAIQGLSPSLKSGQKQ